MIDSTLYVVDLPAGTYNQGDVIELDVHTGPSTVRSGRGRAVLKQIETGMLGNVSGSVSFWRTFVQNSDWNDAMCNHPGWMMDAVAFSEDSSNIQSGCDADLTPNSGWRVWAVCMATVTTTIANSIYCLIDIDYPDNGGVVDPSKIVGLPASIQYDDTTTETLNALGAAKAAGWKVRNVDNFKAGYKYVLQKATINDMAGNVAYGFLAFSNAAGMAGLTRIIPVTSYTTSIRSKIRYASVLVKGPMDVKTMLFLNAGTASSTPMTYVNADWVKKKV